MKKLTLIISSFLLLGVWSQNLNADLIAAWDVNGIDVNDGIGVGASPSYSFNSTSSATNASGVLTLGDVNPSTTASRYGFKISGANTQTDLAGAIANNHYLQFTINIDSGYILNLNNIEINGESTPTGADDIVVMSSVDGFTAGNEIASLTGRNNAGTGDWDTDGSGFGAPIDVSGSQYQGLTGSVSFRVYGYNTGSGAGSTYIRGLSGNDLVVDGTLVLAAIPEPTTFLMFGAALAGLGLRRRR